MPIYEYQCDACGHHLEALRKISDKPLKKCPECGKPRLKRLLSAPMFLLKGSGWYETDFKTDKETKRNLADRPEKEEAKAESTPESKTDAKPETTAETKPDSKPDSKPETKPEAKTETKPASTRKRVNSRGLRKTKRRRA
jgi:putative FmdB family regulatory protein